MHAFLPNPTDAITCISIYYTTPQVTATVSWYDVDESYVESLGDIYRLFVNVFTKQLWIEFPHKIKPDHIEYTGHHNRDVWFHIRPLFIILLLCINVKTVYYPDSVIEFNVRVNHMDVPHWCNARFSTDAITSDLHCCKILYLCSRRDGGGDEARVYRHSL